MIAPIQNAQLGKGNAIGKTPCHSILCPRRAPLRGAILSGLKIEGCSGFGMVVKQFGAITTTAQG